MPRLERKHSLATRLFHWANAPILAVMTWSGVLIYWANDVYAIRVGSVTLIKFFPDWFYRMFHVGHRLAEGMAWHFTFMWFFAINGLLYVAYTVWSGEWRELVPNRGTFAEAWQVVLHDLGVRKDRLPRRKFNGAQRLAYTGVVGMGAGSLLTGLAIYKPVQVAWLTGILGGYELARAQHFALACGYVLFFVIHIAQVTRAGLNNFRAMVVGVEVAVDEEPTYEESRINPSGRTARARRAVGAAQAVGARRPVEAAQAAGPAATGDTAGGGAATGDIARNGAATGNTVGGGVGAIESASGQG
jgi:thiosulfate reductase cytochrome b subunit